MTAPKPKTGDLFASAPPSAFRVEQWWRDSHGAAGARGTGVDTYDQALALVKEWLRDTPLAAPGDFVSILDRDGRKSPATISPTPRRPTSGRSSWSRRSQPSEQLKLTLAASSSIPSKRC